MSLSSYVDLATIHVPSTGSVAPASWGLQIRENQEAVIEPPNARVFNSTDQSVADGILSPVVLTADSEEYDNDGMHSTVSNTARLTAQTDGRYLMSASVTFDSIGSGTATGAAWFRQGASGQLIYGEVTIQAFTGGAVSIVEAFTLNAGDFVVVMASHNVGSAHDVRLRSFTTVKLSR